MDSSGTSLKGAHSLRNIWSTRETLKTAADVCRRAGGEEICAAVTRGLLMGKAFEESAIEKMWVTGAVSLPEKALSHRVEAISAAPLLRWPLSRSLAIKSISSLSFRLCDFLSIFCS